MTALATRGRTRSRGLFWLAVLVAVVASGGGAVYAYSSYQQNSGPDGAVRAYFQALARGDASAVLAAGAIPAGSREYLTREVLDQQRQLAPISDIAITGVERHGDRASVSYSYNLDFARGTLPQVGSTDVAKVGGQWRLAAVAVAGTFKLDQAVERASFAGTAVPPGQTLVFPGAIPITFDSPYIELEKTSLADTLGQGGIFELDAEATHLATTTVEGQLKHLLADCVTGSAALSTCPPPTGQYVPGTLHGTVVLDTHDFGLNLTTDPAGSASISATAKFVGTYRLLSFDNVAQNRTGSLTIAFAASAYLVTPLVTHFVDPS